MSVIIITGGSRGIGASCRGSMRTARHGRHPHLQQQPGAADAVVRRIEAAGGKAVALAARRGAMRKASAVPRHRAARWNRHGAPRRCTGSSTTRATGSSTRSRAVTPAQFDGLMNVHLKGPFFLTQALLPLIEQGASIVNLTSATTRVATAGVAPYAAFKGGLEVLTRYMAKEFGERRIRANAVSPGAIRTELGGGLTERVRDTARIPDRARPCRRAGRSRPRHRHPAVGRERLDQRADDRGCGRLRSSEPRGESAHA
jgi:NAD(P)-dependent dehydrogenase (short-subunit alcohol dehydrogenase family)